MKKYLLGVDNGGTYIKAAIYDKKGKRLGIARQYNEVLKPKPGRNIGVMTRKSFGKSIAIA